MRIDRVLDPPEAGVDIDDRAVGKYAHYAPTRSHEIEDCLPGVDPALLELRVAGRHGQSLQD